MVYEDFVPERLAKLRMQKGVSARDKENASFYAVLLLYLRIPGRDTAGILR